MNDSKICISSHSGVYITKFALIPILSLLILIVGSLVSIENFESNFWIGIASSIIICMVLFSCYYLYSSFKILYIDKNCVYFDKDTILWKEIEKVYFPILRPKYLVVKMKRTRRPIITILPSTNTNKIKVSIKENLT